MQGQLQMKLNTCDLSIKTVGFQPFFFKTGIQYETTTCIVKLFFENILKYMYWPLTCDHIKNTMVLPVCRPPFKFVGGIIPFSFEFGLRCEGNTNTLNIVRKRVLIYMCFFHTEVHIQRKIVLPHLHTTRLWWFLNELLKFWIFRQLESENESGCVFFYLKIV